MDLVQKHGHLKSDKGRSYTQSKDNHESQQAFNSLLGNFGHPHNDHPDRRSSGAGNMARDIEEWTRQKKSASSEGVSDLQGQ
ncbi:hypothetical protein ETB97_004817 [Aspergillus alliaceus]|uniref:Uncharacterized protein n=1 Tax=Petromyces alliaceus TaxID=209559 RepID=A0A5N6FRY7_PETAA|nr:uncharacterized protein BDW43DRAFT_281137 [Aspergillus alliaceus]KAB8231945.1 hypothetical protein BDW43DRAFT_281137 [Aspergillus alliaceus]KAE8387487.1 hypothetical protein BDV23DRAFT_160995 [Aspergillus alliaceus]KAF5865235.1 hypothetical protein ETB97_004817 [Aspergillus burnettii]